ncbi:CTP synthase family protein [Prunus dulcis]|uniref:CTP synthase family protein n=1 Tax=Prunus dulcis TaxID=3755 RepID=A0A4Y1RF19_PRUDU|nr:CTP synthase family protein [Prunus dulcis]
MPNCLASLLVSFEVLDNLCSCAQRVFKKLLWGGLEVANALIFSVLWGWFRGQGLTLTILACRSTKPLEENAKLKLAQFCCLRPFAFGNFSSLLSVLVLNGANTLVALL